MKSKNVLLVISKFPPEYSGPGVRIPRLYDWFKQQGKECSVQVVCNGIEQTKSGAYEHDGMPVRRVVAGWLRKIVFFLPRRLRDFLIYQAEFVQTFFALGPYKDIDLMHVAGHSGGTAAALLLAKMRGIPVLMELVTEYARHQQKIFGVFTVSVPEKGKVVALTKKAKQECVNLGLDKDKIWRRPNPIDDSVFKPSFDEKYILREKLTPFSKDHKVISNVAKMMPQKNQFLIVKALAHLPDDFVAVLGGPLVSEGPLYERDKKYVQEIEDFISAHDLKKRVLLVPDFVKADEYMKLADVYAMPAWNEGFGTPMMEAMGCGVPVVANKGENAFREWIVDEENGYLCDIEKPEEWAAAIEKAAGFAPEQCLDISARIHKKAGQDAIYTQYENIIDELLYAS